MPDLIVIHKPLYYNGEERPVGARFSAPETDARYLMKRLQAEPAPAPTPLRKVVSVAPPPPETPPEPFAPEDVEVRAPVYRTRRLKAED